MGGEEDADAVEQRRVQLLGTAELGPGQFPAQLDVLPQAALELTRMTVQQFAEHDLELPGPQRTERLVRAGEVRAALGDARAQPGEHLRRVADRRRDLGLDRDGAAQVR